MLHYTEVFLLNDVLNILLRNMLIMYTFVKWIIDY